MDQIKSNCNWREALPLMRALARRFSRDHTAQLPVVDDWEGMFQGVKLYFPDFAWGMHAMRTRLQKEGEVARTHGPNATAAPARKKMSAPAPSTGGTVEKPATGNFDALSDALRGFRHALQDAAKGLKVELDRVEVEGARLSNTIKQLDLPGL